ncbi:hypothetical protein DP115_14440 [Brasilonema octagenarum UFV-OR1]|uniref:DUF4340 domain-containing protein n=1 Tax=Brasilonema octagenarum UFV-OR1 TaxID=417115 RepID=A0ABX1M5U3_9CYAN|nr:hypothetical protein [Brasilonema octagenarum UFV-OR1]
MKLQRTTLILILLALGLGGFVYFHEIKNAPEPKEVKQQQKIFSFKEDDVQSLTVKTQNQTLNLERTDKSEEPKWMMKSPEVAPASSAIVGYLMNLLVEGKSDRIVSISPNQLAEFGLDQPQTTIDIKLKNQKTHQLILGKPDFNRRFLYAQIDPQNKPGGNNDVLLVSTDFENAVNRELSEWKQPIDDGKKPTPSIEKPIDDGKKPTPNTAKPIDDGKKPTPSIEKSTDDGKKPTPSSETSIDNGKKPTPNTDKPTPANSK